MQINEQDIWDRAVENGMVRYPNSENERCIAGVYMEAAEAELEQEHLADLFRVHSEAVRFIAGFEDNPSEIAWLLMKGMTEDDDGVYFDRALYFGPWEITWRKGQWMFEHTQRNASMFDIFLLNGLRVIEEVENEHS